MANGFDPNQSSVEFGMGLLEKTQKDIRRRQKEAQRVNKFVALKKLTESALINSSSKNGFLRNWLIFSSTSFKTRSKKMSLLYPFLSI